MRKWLQISIKSLLLCLLFLSLGCGIKKSINDVPNLSSFDTSIPQITKLNDSTFTIDQSFLTKNRYGLWELYVEGDAYQRGLKIGSLTESLMDRQEKAFLSKVREMVPSESKQRFLRKFLSWYNRKMYKHIPNEFKAEIYGLSQYASDEFNDIAPPYLRMLYLHSAHDIGHALKDLALVGCTSFAVWDKQSEDGQLLIGRNFDFYAGDEFAKEKIIAFINPKNGNKFMSVSWGGMIGVVSGMNDKGLTVSINAGKSKIPLMAKTPISILSREILQYASNIKEAIEIARKRDVFVSESIMVGSAKDGKAVLIEVSPSNFGVFEVENGSHLICSNHFQSEPYSKDRRNQKTIKESHSKYRYERMEELLKSDPKIDETEAVEILRNTRGLRDVELGYGNEKAINQLLAHHGIVFKPEELKVWVSSNPYQMGEFVAYDLKTIFKNGQLKTFNSLAVEELTIAEDPFIYSEKFENYQLYRLLEGQLVNEIDAEKEMPYAEINKLTNLNPEFWKAYFLVGKYYYSKKEYQLALDKFMEAKKKEVTSLEDEQELDKYIKKAKRKIRR